MGNKPQHNDQKDRSSPDLGEHKALSKLKNRGGKGQEGIAIVGGAVLTVKENAAVTIAKDVIDDARRANDGKLASEIPLIEIAKYAQGRSKPGVCTDAEVLAEICRIQNAEIYGGKIARR